MRSRHYQRGVFGIDDLIIAGIVAAGAGASAEGQREANSSNMTLSRENMLWQEAMRRTNYQAAVYDMEKAGLNPAMMYMKGGGGATTPSPNSPPKIENVAGVGVSSAMQGMQVAQGIQGVQTSKAQEAAFLAQADRTKAETVDNNLHSAKIAGEIASLKETTKLARTNADNVQQQILGSIADSATKHAMFQNMNRLGAFGAEAQRKIDEGRLTGLEADKQQFFKRGYEGANKAVDEGIKFGKEKIPEYWERFRSYSEDKWNEFQNYRNRGR